MIRINQLKLPLHHTQEDFIHKIEKSLRISKDKIAGWTIVKQSVDARKKPELFYSYVVDVELKADENKIIKKIKDVNITINHSKGYSVPEHGKEIMKRKPVIVGFGPAGIFCGLMLAREGYCPVIFERGDDVDTRTEKVSFFWETGILDVNSNVQFGEGGAGTFSDGKLNTLVKDPVGRNKKVLELFVEFGADPKILYQNKPHIGTDVLSKIVKQMRQEILTLGGQIHFNSQVTDLIIENQQMKGCIINHQTTIMTEHLILAIGHSARDTFQRLHQLDVPMEQKAFAVGLRIQHPQSMINQSQYGCEHEELLGAASYKVTHKALNGRGVYSFCMCPGGYVVNASSEPEMLAVNGMSNHGRDSFNANSALIVTVTPEDFQGNDPLSGIEFQRNLERKAYEFGSGKIPVQLYGDFKNKVSSQDFGDVHPEFKGQYAFANLREAFPDYINIAIIDGIEHFDHMIHGFSRHDTILAGIESRTSSPIRIFRNEQMESSISGLYPCGEGAGYAGGITSAAMDGIKIAEAIIKKYCSFGDQ